MSVILSLKIQLSTARKLKNVGGLRFMHNKVSEMWCFTWFTKVPNSSTPQDVFICERHPWLLTLLNESNPKTIEPGNHLIGK